MYYTKKIPLTLMVEVEELFLVIIQTVLQTK